MENGILHHDANRGLMICKVHGFALLPDGIEDHLRNKHKLTKRDGELDAILRYIETTTAYLSSPSTAQPPCDDSPRIPFIEVVSGFACNVSGCNRVGGWLSKHRRTVTKHLSSKHGITTTKLPEGQSFAEQIRNVKLQSIFGTHIFRPFIVNEVPDENEVENDQEKYKEAEIRYRKALRREKKLSKEQEATHTSIQDFPDILRDQRKYEKAEVIYRDLIQRWKRMPGKEPSEILPAMEKLADVLCHQEKYKEAEKICRKRLQLCEEMLSKEHSETLASMRALANVFCGQEKYLQAAEICREVLQRRQNMPGKEPSGIFSTMINLADVLCDPGDQEKYGEAEEIYRILMSDLHPSVILIWLTIVLCGQEKYKEAEGICYDLLEYYEGMPDKEPLEILEAMEMLADILCHQEKYKEAEKICRKRLQLCEKVLGEEDEETLASMQDLACVLADQKKYYHQAGETIVVTNHFTATGGKRSRSSTPQNHSDEAESKTTPGCMSRTDLIATRKRKRTQTNTSVYSERRVANSASTNHRELINDGYTSTHAGIASNPPHWDDPDTPVRSIEVGRSYAGALERIDENLFEHFYKPLTYSGDDGGGFNNNKICDDVEDCNSDKSSEIIHPPSSNVLLIVDGASEDLHDRTTFAVDDNSSLDPSQYSTKQLVSDGRVDCDINSAPHNAGKDKSLCTKDPLHIIKIDADDGPLEEVSPAQRLSSNLQFAIANLQPRQCLTDAAICSVLDLVPQVSIQVLSGSYLSDDSHSTIGAGRLRIKLGVSKIIAPIPLQHPSLHWCLGVFDLELKTITLYNSWRHEQYLTTAKSILMRCGEHLSRQNPQHNGPWEWCEAVEFPQQANGWDCGVFVLVAAIHVMLDMSIPTIIDGALWRSLLLTLVNRAGSGQMPQACTSASANAEIRGEVNDDADFAKQRSFIKSSIDHLHIMSGATRAILGQIMIQIHKSSADPNLDTFSSSQDFARITVEHTAAPMASLTKTRHGLMTRSKDVARRREYYEVLAGVWSAGADFLDLERERALQCYRSLTSC